MGAVSSGRDRVTSLASWHDDWSALRVAVLGLGDVGFSVADTLVELGSRVTVIYDTQDHDRERLLDVIGAERACVADAEGQLAEFEAFDPELVVIAGDTWSAHAILSGAAERGLPVWNDIELGWRLRDKTARIADWMCVAGESGRATVSELTARMLLEGGFRAIPTGAGASPILDALRDPEGYDAIVVELTSTQLERLSHGTGADGLPVVGAVSPYSSLCLELLPEPSQQYLHAMGRVFTHTQVACVYPRALVTIERLLEEADVIEGARAVSFGLDTPPSSGLGVVENILVDRGFHAERKGSAFELVTLEELAQLGLAEPRMVQKILAAAALARSRGAEPGEVTRAILNYGRDRATTQDSSS